MNRYFNVSIKVNNLSTMGGAYQKNNVIALIQKIKKTLNCVFNNYLNIIYMNGVYFSYE